jgi:hypothetical protein
MMLERQHPQPGGKAKLFYLIYLKPLSGVSMDALFIFRHSPNHDFEIRQSLRSIDQYAPFIRKVWIFGDRPAFISDDLSLIEHVPHERLAGIIAGTKLPVVNVFLSMFLSSLIPDLSFEYLSFSDDYFLLKDFSLEMARKDRYLENLTVESPGQRGHGPWKESLWRTRDLLVRLGYPAYNFETHTPAYFTRKRVLDAYCDFRDFITQDRLHGMMGKTAVLNHALKPEKNAAAKPELVPLKAEATRGGFWGQPPASRQALVDELRDKTFFNFDDAAF